MGALEIDLNQLTLGELEDLEEVIGRPIEELIKTDDDGAVISVPKKAFTAFVWILKRRDDPALTIDDVRKMRVVDIAPEAKAPPGPTNRAARRAVKPGR